jgi:hypothetical protein
MKSILKASVLFFMIITNLNSLLAEENQVGKHNVGVGAGFITGYGLSYRQWINAYGFQVNLAPYYNKDENSKNASFSLGITGLRLIKEADYVNLIAYFGSHYHWIYERFLEYYDCNEFDCIYSPAWVTTKEHQIYLGGGTGIDIHFWKISYNLMFGIVFHTDFDQQSGINFSGETALYYSF